MAKETHAAFKSVMLLGGLFLAFAAMAVLYIYSLINTQEEETRQYLSEVAQQEASTVGCQINGDMETVESLALLMQKEIQTTGKIQEEELLPLLQALVISRENNFLRFFVVRRDGTAFGSSMDGAEVSTRNYKDELYVQRAFAGVHYVSDTEKDVFTDRDVNVYSVPLLSNNRIIGVFCAVSWADELSEILDISTFRGMGFAHIVKSSGELMIRSNNPDSDHAMQNCFDAQFVREEDREQMRQDMQDGLSGVVQVVATPGRCWLAYVPVKGVQDWYVLSVVPATAVNTKFVQLITMTICAILLLALTFLAILLWSRREQAKHQKTVLELAYYDSLTGAFNRNKFNLELGRLLQRGDRDGAVIVINLNNFKAINELFGVSKGNALLKHIATVLEKCLKEGEFFSRGEADTFYLYLKAIQIKRLPDRMMGVLEEICSASFWENTNFNVSVRCGIYKLTGENEDIDANLITDRAELALTTITNRHTNRIAFYDERLHQQELENNEIESMMQAAVVNHEFVVYLQPQYDVKTETLAGAEALVRWQNPALGFIAPNRFVPLFEENGFATTLDDYVLEAVCKRIRSWLDAGFRPGFSVSVNQSRLHLYDKDYTENLQEILSRHEISPSSIQLEITESAAIDNVDMMLKVTKRLHEIGFCVSMDDFGSGYSSLNVLKDICVDELKLDKQFFDEASDTPRGRQIISSILAMANRLSIHTVAEGIERGEQVEFLREHGCELIQGYYYARPMPMEEFEKLAFGRVIAQKDMEKARLDGGRGEA